MEGSQIVEIVAIVVGAVVTIASLYLQLKMRQMERKLENLESSITSVLLTQRRPVSRPDQQSVR